MLSALARWCGRHRKAVVLLWVVLAVGLLAGARLVDGGTAEDVVVPGSDSEAANALLAEADMFGRQSSQLVLTAPRNRYVDASELQTAVREVVDAVSAVPGVGTVPERVEPSPDRTAVRFSVPLDVGTTADKALAQRVLDATEPARAAGMDVALGGALGRQLSALNSRPSEIIGIVAALVVLLLAFGSAVAALLPVVTALLVVVGGLAGLDILKSAVSLPDVAPTLAAMIGLGVGVDYTLFLVSRQRRLLATGLPVPEAVARTARSAGAAVVFAGATVIVSISGLMLTGVDFVSWLGWSSALLVAGAVLSAVTLTPAVLAMAGERLGRGRPAPAADEALDGSVWGRFASWSARRPVAVAIASTVLLLGLGAPALALRLGQSDAGDRGTDQQTVRHYLATAAAWGPGENGPLSVVLTDPARAEAATAALRGTNGVASVSPPRPLPSGAVSLRVVPTTAPSDPTTDDLVERLRDEVLPRFGDAHVGGGTATRIDLADRITGRLPWLILAVIGVSCVLLLLAFRSVLLPVKAALMNIVSVCAAYGVVTAVFQWGWGADLIGLDGPVPIDSYVPMVLFAVLFGLSMDYEVFLLSAIQEHWARTGDNHTAVRRGLAETGGVITSAALIMVCVFASFILVDNPTVKVFGLGLATAIVVDATIVRCLLVPATMVLLGRWNWWLPGRLDRLLPHLLDHRAPEHRTRAAATASTEH
ncbi:RND superfamily putative drug exporter [Saccharothrix carnea]|uniref:RND superfamily putative drug exporter n=1 Tax=Saccharothrix carnea TaxID=1280637 RepID=A0A2P8I125_SACCR|nr:MMPL family transporter [Saccharothrix carnea]PSL52165.1 RND superfamily putative drug exporter [Saccharothrix carnea]